jgi:hypothetical protein
MGKYTFTAPTNKPKEPPAIWRGIGCILIIVVPIISLFIGTQLVNYALANNIALPRELLGRPVLPDLIKNSYGLYFVFGPLEKIQNLYAILFASFVCLVLISSLISMVYAVVYRIVNPYRYGPTDAPPPKKGPAKKSR